MDVFNLVFTNKDLLNYIYRYLPIETIKHQHVNKFFSEKLIITDLSFHHNGINKLNDNILLLTRYKNIIKLNASNNPKITDNGIKHMMLHTLNTYNNPNIKYNIKNYIKTLK